MATLRIENTWLLGIRANERETKSCLAQVFNFKLGCFCDACNCLSYTSMPTSRVENSARVLSLRNEIQHNSNQHNSNQHSSNEQNENKLIGSV
jgi:hypothetical protein